MTLRGKVAVNSNHASEKEKGVEYVFYRTNPSRRWKKELEEKDHRSYIYISFLNLTVLAATSSLRHQSPSFNLRESLARVTLECTNEQTDFQ